MTGVETPKQSLHGLLQRIPTALVVCDSDGHVNYYNEAAGRILGKSSANEIHELLMAAGCWYEADNMTLLAPDMLPINRALQGSDYEQAELVYADGQDLKLSLVFSAARIFTDQEASSSIIISINDISELRQLQQELADIKDTFRRSEHQVDMGHYEWDYTRDAMVMFSDNYPAVLRIPREDVITCHSTSDRALETVHPDDRKMYLQTLGTAMAMKLPMTTFEYRSISEPGEVIYLKKVITFNYDDAGKPVRSLGSIQDITSSKQTENAFKLLVSKLDLAQTMAQIGIWEFNHQSREYTCTPEFFRICEMDPVDGDRVDEMFNTRIHPDDRKLVNSVFERSMEQIEHFEIDYRLKMPDGRIKYVHERCGTHLQEAGKPVTSVGVLHDVSKQQNMTESLNNQLKRQSFIADLGVNVLEMTNERQALVKLFDNALTGAAALLNVEFAKVLELEADREVLLLLSGIGWKVGMVGQAKVPNDSHSQAGYTVVRAEPVVVESLDHETRFEAPLLLTEHDVKSGVSVIIGQTSNPYGVLGIHSSRIRSWPRDDVYFVQSLANVLAGAFQKLADHRMMVEHSNQLRELNQKLIDIREKERRHIGREIHDELGQNLTGLRMDLLWMKDKLADDDELLSDLVQAVELTENSLQSVRRISQELYPSVLYDLGLVEAIKSQLLHFSRSADYTYTFDDDLLGLELAKELEIVLYRVFQEALTNIIRHAHAKAVSVSIHMEDGRILMTVADDGKGLSQDAFRKNRTIGIFGMQERVREHDGSIEILSNPGEGQS